MFWSTDDIDLFSPRPRHDRRVFGILAVAFVAGIAFAVAFG